MSDLQKDIDQFMADIKPYLAENAYDLFAALYKNELQKAFTAGAITMANESANHVEQEYTFSGKYYVGKCIRALSIPVYTGVKE